jgi:hypothetical protein
MIDIASFVEILLYYKSHVGKRQIYEISHQDVIVIHVIESISVSKFELWLIKFTYFEMITFQSTGLSTIDNVVVLSQKLVSVTILEEHSIFGDIIGYNLTVVDQVPYNNTIFNRSLRYSNGDSMFVTSGSDLFYPRLFLSLVHIDSKSVELSCGGV